jgi:hypothetical protein
MFERFSSGYFLGEMFVEPRDGDHAVMSREAHERLNEHLYLGDEGVEPLDAPLVMKLDGPHFPVLGDDETPPGTLAVPGDAADGVRLYRDQRVLLADADRADQMLRYAGWEAPTGR